MKIKYKEILLNAFGEYRNSPREIGEDNAHYHYRLYTEFIFANLGRKVRFEPPLFVYDILDKKEYEVEEFGECSNDCYIEYNGKRHCFKGWELVYGYITEYDIPILKLFHKKPIKENLEYKSLNNKIDKIGEDFGVLRIINESDDDYSKRIIGELRNNED